MKLKKLYRYEIQYDEYGSELVCRKFIVEKETTCGYWIKIGYSKSKWVSKDGRNRYAMQTEELALINFIRRKTYRNHCIENELDRNYTTIRKAKRKLEDIRDEQKRNKTNRKCTSDKG